MLNLLGPVLATNSKRQGRISGCSKAPKAGTPKKQLQRVPCTWCHLAGTWFQCTRLLGLYSRFKEMVSGIWYLFSSQYQEPRTRNQQPGTCPLELQNLSSSQLWLEKKLFENSQMASVLVDAQYRSRYRALINWLMVRPSMESIGRQTVSIQKN